MNSKSELPSDITSSHQLSETNNQENNSTSSILDAVPEENSTQHKISKTVSLNSFSSPLPPPEILKQYEDMAPGTIERLLSAVESDAKHIRHIEIAEVNNETKKLEAIIDIEKEELRARISEANKAQIFALTLGIIGIVAGLITVITGSPVSGAAIIGSTFAGGLGMAFIGGRKGSAKNDDNEDE